MARSTFGDEPTALLVGGAPHAWAGVEGIPAQPIDPSIGIPVRPLCLQAQASDLVALAIGGPAAPPPLLSRVSMQPAFTAAIPLCALPGSGRHSLQGLDMTRTNMRLRAPSLHCRQQGRNLVVELLDRGLSAGAAGACRCRGSGAAPGGRAADGGSCCPVVNIGGLHIGARQGPRGRSLIGTRSALPTG